ncbi:MAG: hypothetical protein A2Y38_12645 [Spirochaetes bacterium GWB1_59_5]|nr:MAG: hypothetical protein A2Y38_12645 [Spirochaetes bacterium GWB1_59_5]
MTKAGARRMVHRLILADVAKRLGNRFVAWAATAFAAWSLALLVAVTLAESSFGPSAFIFHALVMAVLGSLPAFLAAPVKASSGSQALRRADREAAAEAWLDYTGGPAERLLERRACEALSIATITGLGRPRPTRTARILVASLFALGFVSFAIAQIVSVYSGYGVSLTYPDKEIPDFVAQRDATSAEENAVIMAPGIDPEKLSDEQRDAPGARRYGDSGSAEDEALMEPDFVAPGDTGIGAAKSDSGDDSIQDTTAPSAGRSAQARSPGSGAIGGENAENGDEGSGDSTGEACAPGWEGSGLAIESSPFVDYRARFERQLTEATGKETQLGDRPSAELVSAAITEFYASFDARVAVGVTMEPGLTRAMELWRRAFSSGASK